MINPELSVIISSYRRLEYLKRTLFSIAINPPRCHFEVVIADEISDESEDILKELHKFDARFPWTFVKCDVAILEKKQERKKYFNNPSWTNNIAYKNSSGKFICLMGNEMISYKGTLDTLLNEARTLEAQNIEFFTLYTKTLDCPKNIQDASGTHGANLTAGMVEYCEQWPLQSIHMRSMVTNYLSCSSKATWEATGGYDENYVFTLACEDSDWSMRARVLPNYTEKYLECISLHQNHSGRTCYQEQDQSIITNTKWDEGVAKGREYLATWDKKTAMNRQTWEPGTIGITKVKKHGYV
jgi:glycosyltransferase involved in cell wall biosynthesis